LIAPLYGGKSLHDFLAVLNGQSSKSSHDLVQDYWKAQKADLARFDAFWEKTLRDGVVADTAFPPMQVSLKSGIGEQPPTAPSQGLEIVFRPDPTIWDGRLRITAGYRNCPNR